MKIKIDNLKKDEQISLKLEEIYEKYGYRKFKMRSFEEYSMYLSYSDFLLSKNIITFSGLDGKLRALRPDVTLSIIKNSKASETNTEKLFYNEKVYRELGKEYKEISQTGVEYIGEINLYSYAEVILLALKSLECISSSFVLDLSDMEIVSAVIDAVGLDKAVLVEQLKTKNIDEFLSFAKENNLSKQKIDAFTSLIKISAKVSDFDLYVDDIAINDEIKLAIDNFKKVCKVIASTSYGDKINVNFSIYGNADYYNGLVFNGYIEGVPKAVLSGGRYDKLLQKFGKNVGALGFAVYMGEIERYLDSVVPSTDILIIYDEKEPVEKLINQVEVLNQQKYSVRVDKNIPSDFKYGKLYHFKNGELVGDNND